MAKNYIRGSAKEVKFKNGGSVINLSVSLDQLNELPVFTTKNGDRRVSISVSARREADNYGNTHSVYHDDYFESVKDGGSTPATSTPKTAPVGDSPSDDDDLPF